MKWVKISDGKHKLVPDSDPRPEDTEFANRTTPPGSPHIAFKPSWAVFEPSMRSHDPKVQRAATDLFMAERTRETAMSSKARRWEQSRKESWAKDKPTWRKRQQIDA